MEVRGVELEKKSNVRSYTSALELEKSAELEKESSCGYIAALAGIWLIMYASTHSAYASVVLINACG